LAQYDRYGNHEVKTPPATPSCRDTGVVCVTDSTRQFSDECCARSSDSWWLIVASKGDSLELYARGSRRADVTLMWPHRRGWQESVSRVTAPFVRLRLPATTTYQLWVSLDLDDWAVDDAHQTGWPYDLILRRVGQPLGSSDAPLLTLVGNGKTRYEVRPHGVAEASADTVEARRYSVFSTDVDSLDVCRLPCTQRRVVGVRTKTAITIAR
jgi:hypothetical protein